MSDHGHDTNTPRQSAGSITNAAGMAITHSKNLMLLLRQAREREEFPKTTVEDLLKLERLNLVEINPDVLTDLVYAEWMLRIEENDSPSYDEYRSRFPMIASRLEKQWSLEQGLSELSAQPGWDQSSLSAALSETSCLGTRLPKEISDKIGKYKIIRALGTGGQADVYRALHPELDRDVVIKVLRPKNWLDTSSMTVPIPESQFQQAIAEGRLLAKLSHPNIAQVYDIDQSDGYPFLVMEFVSGQTLDQYCHTRTLSSEMIARLLGHVARAVGAAHARGILHRDIKPQNIVVSDDGEPKLIDFGLARIVDAWHSNDDRNGISGTLGFMAPEQARGETENVGPGADIFGLGAVLYYLLTGQSPYHASGSVTGVSVLAILDRVRRCEWDRELLAAKHIPKGLAEICTRAMAANPSARFATAGEFAESLEDFASQPRRLQRFFVIASIVFAVFGALWLFKPNFNFIRDLNPLEKFSTANGPSKKRLAAASTESKILVRRNDLTIMLNDAVPLRTGDELSIESDIPPNVSLALFVINGEGQLQHVASFPKQLNAQRWRYPEASDTTVPLTGAAGTECLVLIGQSTDAVSVEQIKAAWGTKPDWPSLPATSVLHFVGTDVIREQIGRDLGPPKPVVRTSTDQIIETFGRFARLLVPKCQVLEAFAFNHAEQNE